MLNSMFTLSVTQNASDLHFSNCEAPYIRINRKLWFLFDDKLSPNTLEEVLFNLLDEIQKNTLQ